MQFPLYHGLAQRLPCRKSATIIFELKKHKMLIKVIKNLLKLSMHLLDGLKKVAGFT